MMRSFGQFGSATSLSFMSMFSELLNNMFFKINTLCKKVFDKMNINPFLNLQ